MNSKIWEINGCELSFDLEDADSVERYENAFEAMSAEENEIPKDGKQSERIRAYCKLYERLFDRIFGDGTSEKIFANRPVNTAVYDDIYFEFLNFVRNQAVNSAKQRAEKLSKYRPNRQQRREFKK